MNQWDASAGSSRATIERRLTLCLEHFGYVFRLVSLETLLGSTLPHNVDWTLAQLSHSVVLLVALYN